MIQNELYLTLVGNCTIKAELLPSKATLDVANIDYTDDNGVLIIEYRLQLSEKKPDYTINFTRKMQDANKSNVSIVAGKTVG